MCKVCDLPWCSGSVIKGTYYVMLFWHSSYEVISGSFLMPFLRKSACNYHCAPALHLQYAMLQLTPFLGIKLPVEEKISSIHISWLIECLCWTGALQNISWRDWGLPFYYFFEGENMWNKSNPWRAHHTLINNKNEVPVDKYRRNELPLKYFDTVISSTLV